MQVAVGDGDMPGAERGAHDARLVADIRAGDEAAFEALVGRYQARLLAFCRHMLGSREDAEDVLQEVFAAAFNAILADDRPINARPWLYRIARNRSLNHLRRTQPVGVDSMDVHLAEHGATTADKVDKREQFRELIADVQDLPETQRTALLLREIDALSYEQIAEAMETTVPAVKSLLVRARVSLAEAAEARQLTCDDVRVELSPGDPALLRFWAHVRSAAPREYLRKEWEYGGYERVLELPAGYYTLVPFNPSLLSCQKAAKLFAEFLQDFDGKLPRNWRVLPRRKAFQRGQSEVGFYVRPTGSGGGGGGGGGKHPADGRACQGLFRVLHNDKIGSLNLPAGQYKITRLAKRPTCKRASKLFAKFLAHPEGILPNGWKLNARTATFKKGKDAAFRVKRVSS